MKVVQYLESVDPKTRIGIFYMRKASDNRLTRIKVRVSPLLMYRINNFNKERRLNSHQHYVDCVFESDLNSPRYGDSPFCLVRYKGVEGSNIPDNYVLKCVNEFTLVEKSDNPIFHVANKYKSIFLKAENYVRYLEIEVKAKLDDLSWILDPEISYVNIVK